ncbi:hypothetical protein [Nonomuraea sp. MG754425]|uniref:hypothetical protein n=1 Tax=Nonomuraea sp. MG754425 TaxID=2570319 RepID=UPI001F37E68F|nr:hypothetical protein [Nonomuraea sp. MG754425]
MQQKWLSEDNVLSGLNQLFHVELLRTITEPASLRTGSGSLDRRAQSPERLPLRHDPVLQIATSWG